MECTLATLMACFSWSGLYLDSGLSYRDVGMPVTVSVPVTFFTPNSSQVIGSTDVVVYEPKNPYASISLGYETGANTWRLSLEAFHLSSLATGGDRGVNGVQAKLRIYPFRQK
jgi:hypothetical protein